MPPRPAGTRGAPLAARHVGSGLPSARRLLRSEITTLVGSADSLTRATGMERRTPKPLPTGHDEPDPTGAGAYVPGRRLVRAEPGGAGSWGPSTYLLPRAGQGGRFIGRATQDSGNARARWLAPRQAASQPRPAAVYMPPLQERPAAPGVRGRVYHFYLRGGKLSRPPFRSPLCCDDVPGSGCGYTHATRTDTDEDRI